MNDRKMQIHPLVAELASKLTGTQVEIAARAGISAPYLHQLINGNRQPTLETLDKLAEAAGLEVRLAKRKGAKP